MQRWPNGRDYRQQPSQEHNRASSEAGRRKRSREKQEQQAENTETHSKHKLQCSVHEHGTANHRVVAPRRSWAAQAWPPPCEATASSQPGGLASLRLHCRHCQQAQPGQPGLAQPGAGAPVYAPPRRCVRPAGPAGVSAAAPPLPGPHPASALRKRQRRVRQLVWYWQQWQRR